MPTTIASLFDPGALVIVAAGTVLACAARCGLRAFADAWLAAGGLLKRSFDTEANRRALAMALSAIRLDGPYRADPIPPPDRTLALMLERFLKLGGIEALHSTLRAERAVAAARRLSAAQVFGTAGDLAPVFGLIGTLYALTQLEPVAGADATRLTVTAMATAVHSTLYGALLAHLLFYPLASAIERRGLTEEQGRDALADWFVDQISIIASIAHGRRPTLRGVS
jgi:chemotaxis protein MotA